MIAKQIATTTEKQLQELVFKPLRDQSGLNPQTFSAGEYLIGSASHCDFQLTCDGIASEHCRLKFDGQKAVLQAIDSRIWINDTPANGISLRQGDRVSIGPINFILDFLQPKKTVCEPSGTIQDNDSLQSGDHLLQSLQRAISQGRIDPNAVIDLCPDVASSDSVPDEKVLDELNQAIRQSQDQQAEHQQELNRLQEDSSVKIDDLQEEITRQKKEAQSHELSLTGKQDEIEKLSNQFEVRIAELTAREQELQESLSAKRRVEKEWQSQEHEYLFQQDSFEKQLKALEEKLSSTTEQLKTGEEEQTSKEQSQRQLEQQVISLQEEIVTAHQQEKKLEEQFQQELKQAVEEQEKQQQEFIESREQAEQEKTATVNKLAQSHDDHAVELESLQDVIAQKQSQTDSLEQELKQLLSERQQENSDLDRIAEQQSIIDEQKLQIAADKEYIEAAREDVETEKEAFSQVRKDLQEIREQAKLEQQNLQQQFEDLDRQRADFEREQAERTQNFAASPEEEALEEKVLADHLSEPESVDAEKEILEQDEAPVAESIDLAEDDQPLDLDFNMLGDLVGQTEQTATEIEEVDDAIEEASDASDFLDSNEPEDVAEEVEPELSQDTDQPDEVIELRGELAKMFGLDQTEAADESTDEISDTVSDEVETEEQFTEESKFTPPETIEAEAPEQNTEEVSLDDAEDPDSISSYMKALFERTSGKQEYAEPTPVKKTIEQEELSEPEPAPQISTTPEPAEPIVNTEPAEPLAPIATVDHESMALDIASLREVANQTARSALCTHAWKELRVKVLMNGILTVVGGVASAVLLTAPLWGNQSYTSYGLITLLLSGISAIELIRANMMVHRLKTGISSGCEETLDYDCESEQE